MHGSCLRCLSAVHSVAEITKKVTKHVQTLSATCSALKISFDWSLKDDKISRQSFCFSTMPYVESCVVVHWWRPQHTSLQCCSDACSLFSGQIFTTIIFRVREPVRGVCSEQVHLPAVPGVLPRFPQCLCVQCTHCKLCGNPWLFTKHFVSVCVRKFESMLTISQFCRHEKERQH